MPLNFNRIDEKKSYVICSTFVWKMKLVKLLLFY